MKRDEPVVKRSFGRWGVVAAGVLAAMTTAGFSGAASADPRGYGPQQPQSFGAFLEEPRYRAGPPSRGGFVKIANRKVGDRFDRDVIALPGRRRFSEIKLCVRRRAVEFYDLDVTFANGGVQDIGIRRVIYPGECTRNIQLRGRNPRNLEHIILKYTALRKQGRQPRVAVYAR